MGKASHTCLLADRQCKRLWRKKCSCCLSQKTNFETVLKSKSDVNTQNHHLVVSELSTTYVTMLARWDNDKNKNICGWRNNKNKI